jgi:hypothetical protein
MHAAAHQEEEEPHMGNPVVHFEVVGTDAQALQSLYIRAFDRQMQEAIPEYYAIAHLDGASASMAASAKLWVAERVTSPSTWRSPT